MSLHLRPILSALLRNWTGPALVAAQIAIALAVLVNAVYIVKQRVDKINRPTGLDIDNIFVVRSTAIAQKYDLQAAIHTDLAYLRGLPGVTAATTMDYAPLSGRGNRDGVMAKLEKDQTHAVAANYYEVGDQALEALGVHLVQGRAFRPDEILPPRTGEWVSSTAGEVILTKLLADDLYPHGDAVGKTIYDAFGVLSGPATIIGIIDQMYASRVSMDRVDRVMLIPRYPFPDEPITHYVVRTKPGQRDTLMRAVEEHIAESNPERMIEYVRPLEFFKKRSYVPDRNMGIFLVAVTVMLLAITCIGIFGLATFNVSTRTKQIGTRRALGAQQLDIIVHFVVENWLITTIGVLAGCALALGAGHYVSSEYGLPRLDLYYLIGGVIVLWVVGLLAVLYPARRAAGVSPDTATRTV
jgi:putative ABC transport system permease protein